MLLCGGGIDLADFFLNGFGFNFNGFDFNGFGNFFRQAFRHLRLQKSDIQTCLRFIDLVGENVTHKIYDQSGCISALSRGCDFENPELIDFLKVWA